VIDQVTKILVKLNMEIGDSFNIFGDWSHIYFVENPGMAFGLEWGGDWGKLALSLFRIVAIVAIAIYIKRLVERKAHKGLITSVAFILAGAAGNIIDSMFYGIIFSGSDGATATVAALGEGYAASKPLWGFLQGKVVDMLYFPVVEGRFPEWMPFWGKQNFTFFRPIFNVADVAISMGVLTIIVRQKAYFGGTLSMRLGFKSKTEDATDVLEPALATAAVADGASEEQTTPPASGEVSEDTPETSQEKPRTTEGEQ